MQVSLCYYVTEKYTVSRVRRKGTARVFRVLPVLTNNCFAYVFV